MVTLPFARYAFVVDCIGAEGCELGEGRTNGAGHGIERRLVLAPRFIEALRVE